MKFYEKLAAVQAVVEQPKFDSANPHFKSKFASLSECNRVVMEAVREVGGCAFFQRSCRADGYWQVDTVFTAEGETIVLSSVPYEPDANPQKTGSGITYARRYSLCSAFCLVADEDDDGNAASEPRQKRGSAPKEASKAKNGQEGGEGKASTEEFKRLTAIMQTLMGGVGKQAVYDRLAKIYGTTDEGKLDVGKMPQMLSYMQMCADAGVLLEES